jgi:uncharacterized repeat protein (TIGR01451 family)
MLAALVLPIAAQATLTVTPLTWDVVGLDSNSPATGPRHFPVAARVCSDVATTNVAVNFIWDSANANINLRSGSLSTLNFASLPANGCSDAYFEAEVTALPAAFDTVRRYHIAATDSSGTVSTPTPRELYVEHLVSQNRNAITNIRFGPNPGSLTSVAPGGAMNLVVGNTYTIELSGGTATQGYEQLEAFINFTNTVFQILAVNTTYSANTSVYVSSPSDKLYANACGWESDPNSPNYRSCVGTPGKTGGNNIVTQYTIRIIGGGGSSQALNSLMYDFSGSSFHYNADYSTSARIANIIDPTTAGIAKAFSPNPATVNGVSALTITLSNPNAGELGGYAFVDNLPANMFIATPANATTSGCGTPTLTAAAGTQTINFSNGTVAANGSCTIKVNVTTTTTGSFLNTTQDLFIGAVDTGDNASATLVVNNDPPPGAGICGLTLARWNFTTGFTVTAPAATIANVTASAASGAGLLPNSQTTLTADGTSAWGSNGSITTGAALGTTNNEYFEFAINTTGLTQVFLSFDAQRRSANGPQGIEVFWGTTNTRPETGTSIFSNATAIPMQNTTVGFGAGNSIGVTSGLNPSGNTFFRIYSFNSGNTNPGSDPVLDNVLFTGCGTATKPTLTKAFAPDPIAVGGVSTLTFTLNNTNTAALTGARFTDDLPAGTQVAATPSASTTCTGAPTWAPGAGSTALVFGNPTGATIPASGSCTVSVNVTATTAGTKTNVSGFLFTNETGTTTTSVAVDTLTAIVPPLIAKQFAPTPILPGGVSRLTFTISNPNADNAISGVAFSDNLPNAPGIMRVASVPNATTIGCGAPTYAPVANATSVAFSGGAIAAGGTCVVTVDVTAPSVGSYNNVSGNVSHIVNATPINGNTASATLVVNAPNPSISLLKQIGPSGSGPWSGFLAVNVPGNVFYRFVIENTGDAPLSPVSVSDPTVPGAAGCTWPGSLPVADVLDEDHIATCVVGPVAAVTGTVVNTATASGTFSGNTVTDVDSATYADASMSLAKSASPTTYSAAGNVITYTFVVTNTGAAILSGPITVLDNQTTNESCPALSTIDDLDNFFDPGEQITCSATYTITAADVSAGSVVNVASATNGITTSPTDTATVDLIGPRLALTKTAAPIPFVVGVPASYTITVTNNGTASTSGNIIVTDNLPPGITLSSASGSNWSCSGISNLSCTFTGTLTVGSSTVLTLNVLVTSAATTGNNTATASGGGDPTCPAAARCTDSVPVGITAPILTTTKSSVLNNAVVAPSTQSDPGDTIAYTITVANTGDGPAVGLSLSDPLVGVLTCTIGGGGVALPVTLNAGASLVCIGTYTLTAGDVGTGSVSNTATATGGNVCNPTTAGSVCSDSNVTPLGVVPVLTTTKSAVLNNTVVPPSDQSNPGDSIAYTITVVNSGSAAANGVNVVDPLITLSCTIGGGGVALPTTLNAGASLICTGTYVLTAGDVGTGSVSNTATTTGTNVCNPTTVGSTCSDTELVPLDLVPVLATTKSAVLNNAVVAPNDQSNVGDTIAYTVTVTNSGNGPATGVSVADPLIAALSCTIGGGGVTLPTTLNAAATLICTGTYALTAADVNNGSVSNTATVTGGNVCNPTTPGSICSDTEVTPLALVPILTATKSGVLNNTVVPPNTQSDPGDTIAYTITVANSGNGPATGVTVVDPLIGTLVCSIGGGGVTLPITLNAGAALVCTGTYTLTVGDVGNGSVSNTATTTGTNVCNPAGPGSVCSDTNVTPLGLVAVLTTTKTGVLDNTVVPPSGQSNPGDTIAYTITVANSGNGPANGVNIADPLITLSCSIGGGGVTLPTTLNAGVSLICTGTYTLTLSDISSGSVSNTATTTGGNVCNPTTPGSICSDTEVTPLGLVPVLTTSKTGVLNNAVVAPNDQSNPGDSIAYTVTVANTGNGPATGVAVVDPLIGALSCTIGGGGVSLPVTLNAGASLICTGVYTLTALDVGNASVSNTATTSGTNVCNPTTPGSTCSDTEVTPLSLIAILTTAKSAVLNNAVVPPNDETNPGDTIAYTITVTNSGNGPATAVSVVDPLIGALSCSIGGGGVSLPVALNAGAVLTCTGTYVLTALDVSNGSVSNTATTTGGNACNPTSPGSICGDTEVTPLGIVPNLTVDKAHAGNFSQGQIGAQYTLLVSNVGSGPTVGTVSITDTLPTGLTATAISGTGWTCVLPTLTCTRSDVLAAGASYPMIDLIVDVAVDAPSLLINTATVSGGGDTTPGNNTDTDPTSINTTSLPDLTIVKTHSGSFVRGQPGGVYTLVVSNVGPIVTSGTVTVTDTLPAGLIATSIAGPGWTCVLATLTCTRADALAAGASYPPITLNVSVELTAPDSLVNNASVSGGGDSDLSNNTDGDITPIINGQPSGPIVSVPATSVWALLVLGLMMLAMAGINRRRIGL